MNIIEYTETVENNRLKGVLKMSTDKKIRRYLIERIEEEGYPLEIEISNILEKQKGWMDIENTAYFFDSELNMGRTIDIRASFSMENKDSEMFPFFAVYNLAVECKKSGSHAWIFFTRPHRRFGFHDGQIMDFLEVKTDMKKYCYHLFLRRYEKPCLHYVNYKHVAISYTELKFDKSKGKSKHPQILKAANQLMKFISYHNQRIKNTNLEGWDAMPFYFYFPVIVFEGKMYQYSEESGKKNLIPTKRVLLESSHYPSHHYRDVQFAIEIVSKDTFGKLLKDIEQSCSTISSGIIGARQKLMAEYSQFLPPSALKKALLGSTKLNDA